MPARILIAAALSVFLFLLAPGCGDDDGGFKPEDIFRELTSPEDVLHNFEAAYNEMDYGHYAALIRDDFTFVFLDGDLGSPGVPPSGVWGKADELHTHQNMLDTAYTPPAEPQTKIENMQLELAISGELKVSNLDGAPAGTLEGLVTFDLQLNTVGEIIYLVNSRPLFYFVPNDPDSARAWQIWKIEDAGWDHAALKPDDPGDGSITVPVRHISWGYLKGLYWSYKRDPW